MDSITARHSMDGPQTMRNPGNTRTITIPTRRTLGLYGTMSVARSCVLQLLPTNSREDHTEFETGLNAYMGQEGFYLLSDDQEDALKLPKGDYDVPLSLSAKEYRADGSLLYETNGDNGLPGDVIQV